MIGWLRIFAPLLALGLAGCVPFVLESSTANFAASEYSFPLADGTYAVEQVSPNKPAIIINRPDCVEITMFEDKGSYTLIGGFVALKTPGHFIFQATGAMEDGKPVSKKPGEATYIPLRIAATGEVFWYTGPKQCDPECANLLSAYGFRRDAPGESWREPKDLSGARMRAFYEDLAALVDRTPEAWDAIRALKLDR